MPASVDKDPLLRLLAPPLNEKAVERAERIAREQAAKKRSDMIDEALLKSAAVDKRRNKATKVLLLGQASAGKSTVLKNLQFLYAAERLDEQQRGNWRLVILYNLTRSILAIIDAASDPDDSDRRGSGLAGFRATDAHRRLFMRLSPLRGVEETLTQRRLVIEAERAAIGSWTGRRKATPAGEGERFEWEDYGQFSQMDDGNDVPGDELGRLPGSMSLRTNNRGARGQLRQRASSWSIEGQEALDLLRMCQEDIKALWRDQEIRALLKNRRIHIQDSGFFLNDVERILDPKYEPTDEDILRARVRTMGVQEHRFHLPAGLGEFRIYDVGGARSQRAAWEPYFQDVNAIIFLAPISAFDQTLEEDPTVNRVVDSIGLFKTLCKSSLLKDISIVLFLNKCDLLEAKLESGLRVSDYLQTKGLNENLETVKAYFKKIFANIHTKYRNSDKKRIDLFLHFTTVTDLQSTRTLMSNVLDSIMRGNMQDSALV